VEIDRQYCYNPPAFERNIEEQWMDGLIMECSEDLSAWPELCRLFTETNDSLGLPTTEGHSSQSL
jgi:hypothetical protein